MHRSFGFLVLSLTIKKGQGQTLQLAEEGGQLLARVFDLFLIFGMLGLSLGLEKTGAAEAVVEMLPGLASGLGPVVVLAIVYLITSVMTKMVSKNAVAVVLGPIVIGLAQQLGYDVPDGGHVRRQRQFRHADRLPDQHLRL